MRKFVCLINNYQITYTLKLFVSAFNFNSSKRK